MVFPQPDSPTIATYWPGFIFKEISSRTFLSAFGYLNEICESSIEPERRVTTYLSSAISGWVSIIGLIICKIGFIAASVEAMPTSEENAAEI